MRPSPGTVLALCAIFAIAARAQDRAPERPSGWIEKRAVESGRFMVAAANPLAVDAGYRILKGGGSAVDAAITVQLVLGLTEPQSSGLGGGAFLLAHDGRNHKLIAYDGREVAPAAATPERFLDKNGKPLTFPDAVVGGRSVGVPGTVRLLEAAHRKHGKLPWAALFAPAIALAENGFAVSPRLHRLIAAEKDLQPRAQAYFLDADGRPRAIGTILKNPAYAATLRRLAREGADAFYAGSIAQDIVDTVRGHRTNPGDMTLADLANYRVKVRAPVCERYRRYRVCGMPLPSSGGITVLQMLKILEPYDMKSMGPVSFWSVHFVSEAGRLAYADRSVYEADPDFYTPPEGLLDDAYLRARSQSISTTGSLGRATPGDPPAIAAPARNAAWGEDTALQFPSTSHISVVDQFGNALAMTTTIEDQFVYDATGRVYMIAGSPGGSAIINYVTKTLVGVLDWGLDPQRAIDLPNFGSGNGPTELEANTSVAALAPKLRALGHEVSVMEHTSGLHAIVRTKRGWIGGADPRREGTVKGG